MKSKIRNYGRRRNIPHRGFTLIEIILAMGIFSLGVTYVFELFHHSLRVTQKARQQVILSILYQDVKSKQQSAALLAVSGGEDTFNVTAAGGWPTDTGTVGLHDQITWAGTKAAYDNLSPNTDNIDENGDFNPDGNPDFYYENIRIYQGFMFSMATAQPISKENNQFVDWDGYWATDKDGNPIVGITEEEVQSEYNGTTGFQNYGSIDNFTIFGEPAATSGAGITYDPEGMRHYIRRFKTIIAFDYEGGDPSDMFSANLWQETNYCQHEVFYFDVFNPDVDKDTTQP